MFPFVWSVSSSLKEADEIFLFPPTFLPSVARWGNYSNVWQLQPVGRWLWNTTLITVLSLLGAIGSSSLVAYSFAKFRYPGRDLIFMVTLSTMMLPMSVTLIPRYLLFHKLRWLNTFRPLVVPAYFGGGAFQIFLLRQFFMTIPNDLSDAAKIDGANSFRTLIQIILPLTKPALITLAAIYTLSRWNEFMGPLIYLSSPEKFTMAVGLKYFELAGPGGMAAAAVSKGLPVEHLLMAVSVMMTAPTVILFFIVQRYFVRGVVMTGIKG
jgi:ABC-type glycerol-3-phosphate transport system permease component